MAGFRGVGDDAMVVIERQRQASQRFAQLAEQRRSNKAVEQIAGERVDLARQQGAEAKVNSDRNYGLAKEQTDINRQQAETATVNADRERMLAKQVYDKNEMAFQQTKKTWEAEEAQRNEARQLAKTAFSGVIRAALFSPGGAPQTFVTDYNKSIGVADGAPNSLIRALTIRDPKTGMGQAVGFETVGADGKPVRNLALPEQVWAAVGNFGPEKAKEVFEEYSKRYKFNDPLFAAGAKHVSKFDKDRAAALVAEHSRLATESRPTGTMLRDDVESAKTTMANIIKELHAELGLSETDSVDDTQTKKRYTPEESQSLEPGTIYMGTDGRKYKR